MNEEKVHKRNDANPEATDLTEVVEKEFAYTADQLMLLLDALVCEKRGLCEAISAAKANAETNIDTALEVNKFRQEVANSIRNMLDIKERKRKERGVAYKINEEGNQTPYYYDIENTLSRAYNEENAKVMMKRLISESDITSAKVDTMMVTTVVDWVPSFDINDSFEDVISQFI